MVKRSEDICVQLRPSGERRLVKIQRWLTSNAERIARPEKVQLTFDCAGGKVVVEVKERVEAR